MDWQISRFPSLLLTCFLLTLSPTKVPPKFGDNRNGGGGKKIHFSTFYLTNFVFCQPFIVQCILEGPLMARTESRDQYESARSKGGSASPNSTISSIRLTSENFLGSLVDNSLPSVAALSRAEVPRDPRPRQLDHLIQDFQQVEEDLIR